ncbi:hypothetical protein C8R45DRAFT_923104 [Mycena sanguinolenta]|nr:hypothetical protein C8R45DRAFT_923103 [Mycena sanguinolenta]KAJ6506944.1 hypothetical protein C8R45DRAFT_923104 [Mycena sanguinolenta]
MDTNNTNDYIRIWNLFTIVQSVRSFLRTPEVLLRLGSVEAIPNKAAQAVWYPQGVIATGVGTSGVGVQFADLNSGGRTDYLDVNYLTSAVNAWLTGLLQHGSQDYGYLNRAKNNVARNSLCCRRNRIAQPDGRLSEIAEERLLTLPMLLSR